MGAGLRTLAASRANTRDRSRPSSSVRRRGTACAALESWSYRVELRRRKEDRAVIYYALVFLIVGLIAGALGVTGVAAVASQIAWVLFLIGIVLLIVHLATGRRTPTI